MFSFILVIAATAFLSGAVTAMFLVIVIGIRRSDFPRRFPGHRNSPLDSFTRFIIGSRTWPNKRISAASRDAVTEIWHGSSGNSDRPSQ